MKTLKTIGIILGSLIILALLAGLVMPKDAVIERSTVINASAEQIFDHVKMFQKREAWYPWGQDDPSMTSEIKGDDGTVGASRSWTGDSVGSGIQTITKVVDNKSVECDMKFIAPEEAEVATAVELEEVEGGTKVTWAFKLPFGYPFNVMIPFIKGSADAQIGPDFEKGLAMLKDVCDKEAQGIFGGLKINQIDFPGISFVGKRDWVAMTDIQPFFAQNFGGIHASLSSRNISMESMPTGLYYDMTPDSMDMVAAIAIANETSIPSFESINLSQGKALQIDFYGNYDDIVKAHEAIDAYVKYHGLSMKMPCMEEYVTDPGQEPDPNKWLTKITYLIE
jgi:effector-binding domain-containing protein